MPRDPGGILHTWFWVKDIQTLVPAVNPEGGCEPAPAPLGQIWEPLQNTDLDNQPQAKEILPFAT